VIGFIFFWHIISGIFAGQLNNAYQKQVSEIIYDRQGKIIEIIPNEKGYYNQFISSAPPKFKDLLLKKEDRFFFWHPGINLASMVRDLYSFLKTGKRSGSSTITQQLVKILLGNENQRSFKNKIKELFYTESLEWHTNKNEILIMYLNSAYFGGQAQGLKEASLNYFNTPPENLSTAQIFSLLATLSSPSQNQPGAASNLKQAKKLASVFKINIANEDWQSLTLASQDANYRQTDSSFELGSLNLNCAKNCTLTLDSSLSENIRQILKRNLTLPALDTATNGAVVVIKLPENELLSIVGSPNPQSSSLGMQLNMATKPRAIGSTAKPFIYLNAFQKGARPYSLVLDSEIKYQIGSGFDFYPKNFDGQYRGLVTLHQALSNSLNIPSVQVLEFVGLENFYKFLLQGLNFLPQQPLENYELGIALGGLEADPLTLSYFFSLFPQNGLLKPLTLYKSGYTQSPFFPLPQQAAGKLSAPKQVGKEADVELVNKILNDRETGIDQFGLKSNLNLPFPNYALKTGTSRDYHDSWTIGYTPDFLVGVWVGNSDNSAMRQITGLSGAAKVWREVMQLMYNSSYNKNTPLDFSKVEEIQSGNTLDFALKGDDYETARQIMLKNNLILTPHNDDKFLMQKDASIPLSASEEVDWTINNKFFTRSQKTFWPIPSPGIYIIEAVSPGGKKEQITVYVKKDQ